MKINLFKKIIIPVLIFVFLFSPFIASAQALGDAATWIKHLPANFVNMVMGVFVYLFATFAQIAGGLLDWVTSPGFISLPYTKAGSLADGGNPIIEVGLNITKNFVNLGLVVVLVFIALAITLRLEEYATQKTLFRLIVIALLVNFAPVICGLIVDASNIIMNYFLVGIREGISGILTDISTAGLTGTLTRPGSVTVFSLLAKGAVMIILNLFIGLAFLLLTFIFIFRYVAIWVLVILSPLAFVAWILPATKKFWEMWWKQLLNWSFIGIPMAFFLYLAMRSVAGLNTYFTTKMAAPGLEPDVTGLLNNVFPYFAVLAILYLGFFIGLSTTAMGSSAVINFAKARGGQISKATAKKTWQGTRWAAQKTRAKIPEGIRRWGERQTGTKKWGAEETGIGGVVKRGLATVNPARYLRRGFGMMVGGGTAESEQIKIKTGEKTIKDTDTTPTILKKYHDALTDTRRIGILNKLIEKGDLDEAMDVKKHGTSAITIGEVEKITARAKKLDADKTLSKAVPHIAAKNDPEKIKEIISKMKPSDYQNISKDALKDIGVINAILATAMGSHISQLIEKHGAAAAKAIEDGIDNKENNREPVNPRLKKYLLSQPGQGLISPKTPSEEWDKPKTILEKEVEQLDKIGKPRTLWEESRRKQEKKKLETIGQAIKMKREEKKKK
jgi:hypothetical protein